LRFLSSKIASGQAGGVSLVHKSVSLVAEIHYFDSRLAGRNDGGHSICIDGNGGWRQAQCPTQKGDDTANIATLTVDDL
jgi:hypothetical protein